MVPVNNRSAPTFQGFHEDYEFRTLAIGVEASPVTQSLLNPSTTVSSLPFLLTSVIFSVPRCQAGWGIRGLFVARAGNSGVRDSGLLRMKVWRMKVWNLGEGEEGRWFGGEGGKDGYEGGGGGGGED